MDRLPVSPAVQRQMLDVARTFRKEPTPSEAILWQALRGKQLDGRKFRRQQPIGPFIVDFFCPSERLIVEVDGLIHEHQREADVQRQALLESVGYRVIRFSAHDVETNVSAVLAVIRSVWEALSPVPSPLRGRGVDAEQTR